MPSAARPYRPRVLHLIDPHGPMVGPCATAMLGDLAQSTAARQTDLMAAVVGGSGAERLARSLGVTTCDRLAPLGGRPWMSLGPLRRYVAAVAPVDLIHCWSLATLGMAMAAAPGVLRVLTLTTEPISPDQGQWLRVLSTAGRAPVTILTASSSIKRAWAHAGVEPSLMHVLRPGLDLARLQQGDRTCLRREWDIRSDRTVVVLATAQHDACVDASRIASIQACSALSGLDVCFVVPAGASRRSMARSLVMGGGSPDRLIFDARAALPWEVLAGADLMLHLGDDTQSALVEQPAQRGPEPARRALAAARALLAAPPSARPGQVLGVLPMLWAAAAGKAVIAEAGYAVAEVVENGKTALVVKPGNNGAIVQRLRELIDDPQKNWSLRDTARSEAFSFFSCSRYAENLVMAYEQILSSQPVEIPALPMTGGLAFAGRR